MPGAMARPGKRKRSPDGEDAFVDAIYRFLGWVQRNQRAVIAGSVALVLLAGGIVYYVSYRSNLREQAAVELQEIQGTLAGAGADLSSLTEAVSRLDGFVDRYEGTPAAREGRVLLGRIQLRNSRPEEAIATLRPAAELPPDHPLGYAAHSMLAAAYADAGQIREALPVLERLSEEARFGFQRREAADRRAQLLIEAGRLEEAREIYARLVEEAPDGASEESYALKLGEVKAMLRSPAAAGGGSDPTSDRSSG